MKGPEWARAPLSSALDVVGDGAHGWAAPYG